MNYLLLAYADEQQWSTLAPSERNALNNACLAHDEMLQQSGHLLAMESLQSDSTAIYVQVRNGEVVLSDGHPAEMKKQRLRVFYINARDLNEAISVASKMPQAQRDRVEVRPMMTFDAWGSI